jgi:hypothetical protein
MERLRLISVLGVLALSGSGGCVSKDGLPQKYHVTRSGVRYELTPDARYRIGSFYGVMRNEMAEIQDYLYSVADKNGDGVIEHDEADAMCDMLRPQIKAMKPMIAGVGKGKCTEDNLEVCEERSLARKE